MKSLIEYRYQKVQSLENKWQKGWVCSLNIFLSLLACKVGTTDVFQRKGFMLELKDQVRSF